jgi:hypothetical protein
MYEAGIEDGLWKDYPEMETYIAERVFGSFGKKETKIGGGGGINIGFGGGGYQSDRFTAEDLYDPRFAGDAGGSNVIVTTNLKTGMGIPNVSLVIGEKTVGVKPEFVAKVPTYTPAEQKAADKYNAEKAKYEELKKQGEAALETAKTNTEKANAQAKITFADRELGKLKEPPKGSNPTWSIVGVEAIRVNADKAKALRQEMGDDAFLQRYKYDEASGEYVDIVSSKQVIVPITSLENDANLSTISSATGIPYADLIRRADPTFGTKTITPPPSMQTGGKPKFN